MSKTRVYFDEDVLPIVENILEKTGIKTYTDVVNWMVKKYGQEFIDSYNRFLNESNHPTISTSIDLSKLEAFREICAK